MYCNKCGKFYLGATCSCRESLNYSLSDLITSSYEPLKPTFDSFSTLRSPILPPDQPVYDLHNNLIGRKPELSNYIYTGIGGNGPRLEIDYGGYVRNPLGDVIGRMGPGNILMGPDLPSMPDYGPPQSTPDAWDPGFSPMSPFG